MTKRMLGVDYGDARTGLAVSDTLGMFAGGIGCIKSGWDEAVADGVAEKAKEYDVSIIVIGNPVNMNGTYGPRCEKIAAFADLVRTKTTIPVTLFDERLTTVSAHQYLNETNIKSKKRKQVIDSLSAEIILQNYMDAEKNRLKRMETQSVGNEE